MLSPTCSAAQSHSSQSFFLAEEAADVTSGEHKNAVKTDPDVKRLTNSHRSFWELDECQRGAWNKEVESLFNALQLESLVIHVVVILK